MGYIAELKPANPSKWYIVDLRNLHKPKACRKTFESKAQTLEFIDRYYGLGVAGLFTARGTELLEFEVTFKRWLFRRYWSKYKYLKSYSWQKKKNVRRTIRRQQRNAIRGPEVIKWVYPDHIKTSYQKSRYRKVNKRKLLYFINREI
jgi:hypothetical protein